jgi:hypothetical protein
MAPGRCLIASVAALALSWTLTAFQQAPVKDPHGGRFTTGTGLSCAYCHDDAKRPRAENMRAAAARMAGMVDGLNKGALRHTPGIDCVSCHRSGGPEHQQLHPQPLNRALVRTRMEQWPGNPRDSEEVRRAMTEYSVSLGVDCSYCHVSGNWKAADKPLLKTAREMAAMMSEFPKYFDLANASAFTCFTCHQGAAKVPR